MLFQVLDLPTSIGRILDRGFRLFVASLKSVLLLGIGYYPERRQRIAVWCVVLVRGTLLFGSILFL